MRGRELPHKPLVVVNSAGASQGERSRPVSSRESFLRVQYSEEAFRKGHSS